MTGHVQAIEVVMSWGGAPIAAELLTEPGRVEVGDEQGATFLLPSETMRGRFALLERQGEACVLQVPAGAPASMKRTDADGTEQDVDLSAVASDGSGRCAIALGPGVRAQVDIGEFTFWIRTDDAPARVARTAGIDWSTWRWIGLSAALHAVFVVIAMFSPPNASALMRDLDEQDAERIRYHVAAVEKREEVEDTFLERETGGEQSNEGKPMQGDEGKTGNPDEKRDTGGKVRVEGHDEEMRVPKNAEDVERVGALGVLAKATAGMTSVSSPYGADRAAGFSEADAYGPLTSDALGFAPGSGGFGMIGTGRGGGCKGRDCTAGTVGVGELDTVGSHGCSEAKFDALVERMGRAKAMDRCSGTARFPGKEGLDREGSTPVLRAVGAETTGGLAAEQVRRVIHRNRGKIRFCYEQGLRQRPDLAGRVAVKFVIKPSGAVQLSRVAESSIGNREVEQCVTGAVGRLSFPRSPGQTVVTYPFVFARQ